MEEEQGSGAEWYDEWNQSSPDDWLNDDWSLEEQDWNGEWIGSVDDWFGDWSWFEDDWRRKIVQLDCGNDHSLSVQFYVCTGIPFPLVSVMSGIEEELGALELRGVSDVHDCSIDPLCQIGALIASAQGMRSSEGGRQDTWEVNETELKLIRHVKVWRNEMLDPRIKLANRMPVPVLRLTGERLTHKVYRDGSTDGTKIDVDVNAEEGELDQEMRLSEPLLWESEFPPEAAERRGMMKEMDSMRNFEVYDEVKVDDCTQEQIDGALDCRRVKVWKSEDELRCRAVVRGCFQNVEKSEEDNLFASTPSLVTMRLLLCMALARNWGITMGDVSTAFLHALMNEEVFVWPPKESYPEGNCVWRLKKAMYGLRQAPKLWQEHFAEVMTTKLGFRRCKSDPNLYCHESGRLYVLAYVDDLLVVGTDEMRKSLMSQLSEEVLLKETGQLVPGSEHTFLGRRLRHN
eukprot:s6380_g1.t1